MSAILEADAIGFRRPQIDPRPTKFHRWNLETGTYALAPDAARMAADERKAGIDRERIRRHELPVAFDGARFDADAEARENIDGTLARLLRGDGLPVGWIGWRDADNVMRWTDLPDWIVQTQLAGLSATIENRKQALYLAAWQHKAALDGRADADDFAGVLAYDASTNWPG